MNKNEAPITACFLCLVHIYLCLNNDVVLNLGDDTNFPLMMTCFTQNDISPLLSYFFWQQVCYFPDATEQSFPGKSKKSMRTRWANADAGIGAKMCCKLIDNVSGKTIFRSVIRSAIESSTGTS